MICKIVRPASFGGKLKKAFLLLFLLSVLGFGCSEDNAVKHTCYQFVQARIALEEGDSSLIKSITEDSLFRLIMLNQAYINILDAPVSNPNLHIRPKSVTLQGDCASCLMSGYEYYKINLCKYDGQWKVKGENDRYPNATRLAEARKKLIDYKIRLREKPARDSVLTVIQNCFDGAKNYFKTENYKPLKKCADAATIDLIIRLHRDAKRMLNLERLFKEMEAPNYLTVDVKFEGNQISCKHYQEDIILNVERQRGNYYVTGINGTRSKEISNKEMKTRLPELLRAFKLIRSERYRDQELFK